MATRIHSPVGVCCWCSTGVASGAFGGVQPAHEGACDGAQRPPTTKNHPPAPPAHGPSPSNLDGETLSGRSQLGMGLMCCHDILARGNIRNSHIGKQNTVYRAARTRLDGFSVGKKKLPRTHLTPCIVTVRPGRKRPPFCFACSPSRKGARQRALGRVDS